MAYLSNYNNSFLPTGDTNQKDYYQGSQLGNYQFVSLDDIINQFMVAYVGEDKMISKVKRTDVQFHAMRALQELSFDTFKSVKSQQIELPPSLTMMLPHDYVNYTKLSWSDSAGIKHPLYLTNSTSNPFQPKQEADGSYSFTEENEEIVDGGFSVGNFSHWLKNDDVTPDMGITFYAKSEIDTGKLVFSHRTRTGYGSSPIHFGHVMTVYQQINVDDKNIINLSADGLAVDYSTNSPGTLRVGFTTKLPDSVTLNFNATTTTADGVELSGNGTPRSYNARTDLFNYQTVNNEPSYLEWTTANDGTSQTSKTLEGIDVSGINSGYIVVVSYVDFEGSASENTLTSLNNIDNISVTGSPSGFTLKPNPGNETESSTWKNYKSTTPSENNNDDYEDDTYWPMKGNRYGIDPQHAQINGSFYIDQRLGKIHFSSNISGKTVILDYISDSLGTDAEMQVHKFAEEAMYKWLMHAVLSTRANVPEHQVNRLKKERRAAIRQSKLRLSSVKLEEITQILRGKSKQIKH